MQEVKTSGKSFKKINFDFFKFVYGFRIII